MYINVNGSRDDVRIPEFKSDTEELWYSYRLNIYYVVHKSYVSQLHDNLMELCTGDYEKIFTEMAIGAVKEKCNKNK
ncbi:MAG: hypothetical protein ACRC92_20510 [Peptostreptococcaceae bacterium]